MTWHSLLDIIAKLLEVGKILDPVSSHFCSLFSSKLMVSDKFWVLFGPLARFLMR